MVSPDGGVEIEKVAEETPERIFKVFIDPALGLQPFQARELAFALGLKGDQIGKAVKLMTAVYAGVHRDATRRSSRSTRSWSPQSGDLVALDAKITFDDNALFRHPDIKELRDLSEEDAARDRSVEVLAELHQARRHDRLHGQRRRPRDGDDGHHQAGGRRAGELPGRRRRRQRRADQERVPHPDVRHRRQGGADQYLRRHPAVRRARAGRHRRRQGPRRARADRDPHGRHERRARQADAPRKRAQLHDSRLDGRGGRSTVVALGAAANQRISPPMAVLHR